MRFSCGQENCRESLLIEKFCGWQKITFALSQGRRVVCIGSQGRRREGRRVGIANYYHLDNIQLLEVGVNAAWIMLIMKRSYSIFS